MTAIVQVTVSRSVAATPNDLQKKGAIISQGGTNTTPGTSTLLKSEADLTPFLISPAAISALSLATSQIATITTTQAHGLPLNDVLSLTIAGSTGSTTAGIFNGTFSCTITGASAFTYPLIGTAQTGTGGTWVSADSTDLSAMVNTFFDQGITQSVYVLELGKVNPAEGVAALSAYIAANSSPQAYYSYLVPRNWDSIPSFLALLNQFNGDTAKTYFFTTTTLANYTNYTALQKSCFAMIEAPAYGIWSANALTGLTFTGSWGANALTALTWAPTNGGTATATTTTAHGVLPGNTFTISGSAPIGYNGTFVALPGTTASILLYALAVNPGTETGLGTLVAATGGFATATTTSVHGVLPGQWFTIAGSVAATIPAGYNGTFLALQGTTASTLIYALPANPGPESTLGTLVASYYASAGIPNTEFSCAAPFYVTLNYAPSNTNKVTPTSYAFLFGVTPFPVQGTGAIQQKLQDAAINIVGTGFEGGISTAILNQGQLKDGEDFTYWYSVDWAQINIALALANAIINGSNNKVNPLLYNQDGINRLQQAAARTIDSGVTFGLILNNVTEAQLTAAAFDANLDAGVYDNQSVVNAIPFVSYSQTNPNDYGIGQYNGLSCVETPARGFRHIIFALNVTDFVTQ